MSDRPGGQIPRNLNRNRHLYRPVQTAVVDRTAEVADRATHRGPVANLSDSKRFTVEGMR